MNQDLKKIAAEEIITEVRFQGIEAKGGLLFHFRMLNFVLRKRTYGVHFVGDSKLVET